jgi:nucleotide sugar dehydrogenase
VLGAGVVGFATGVGLESLGHDVIFIDIDEDRIIALRNAGHAATHVDQMEDADVEAVFVAVPTPAGERGIDPTYLDQACKTLARMLGTVGGTGQPPPLLVFRSTMPPGTTRQRLIPSLENWSGKRAGTDFLVCYNPEYLREATSVEDFLRFRLLTIGTDSPGDAASQEMRRLFSNFQDAVVTEFTYEEAEFQKYVHNVFNAAKISFFNEMRVAAGKLGLRDPDSVFSLTSKTAEAAWNPLYGIRDFGPYGGACLPKDTAAWSAFARERGITTDLVEAVRSVNTGLGGASC